MCRGYAVTL